jgi:hypothetical protein
MRHIRQGEARLPEHEAAEEGQVDAARHLEQRVEVGDRSETAQPPGQARATAPAQHGEGIEDGAVARSRFPMDIPDQPERARCRANACVRRSALENISRVTHCERSIAVGSTVFNNSTLHDRPTSIPSVTRDARAVLRVPADSPRVASRTLCDPTVQIHTRRTRHRGCTGGR